MLNTEVFTRPNSRVFAVVSIMGRLFKEEVEAPGYCAKMVCSAHLQGKDEGRINLRGASEGQSNR